MHFKVPGLHVDVNKCPLNLNCTLIHVHVQQANFNISICNNSIKLNNFDFCRIYSSMFEKYIAWITFFRSRFSLNNIHKFKKKCHWLNPRCLSRRLFRRIYFFRAFFGIIIKEKCSPFNQGIKQQPIMSINTVITPMTELSDPPSYTVRDIRSGVLYAPNRCIRIHSFENFKMTFHY